MRSVNAPTTRPATAPERRRALAAGLAALWLASCVSVSPAPPQAAVREQSTVDGRRDEYAWLRDDSRSSASVLRHLRAENAHADRWFKPLRPLLAQLDAELRARIPPADEGLPVRRGDYLYHWQELAGADHPRYWRRPLAGGEPELIFDAQRRSRGAEGYELGALAVSPDGRWLAVTEDHQGSAVYTLRIRDLQRKRWLADEITSVDAEVAWAVDSRHLFFVYKDPGTLAALEVRRHRRGRPSSEDQRVHRHADPAYYLSVQATHSHRHVLIHAEATRSSQLWRIDAADPLAPAQALIPPGGQRVQRLRYDDDGQQAWLLSDLEAPDFQLWRADLAALDDPSTAAASWQLQVAVEPAVVLEDFLPLPGQRLVLVERRAGQLGLRLREAGQPDRLLFETDGLSSLTLDDNPEPDPAALRVRRDAWERPGETLALDFADGSLQLLKRDRLAGDFDADAYLARRLWITAGDGVPIPVSLLARRDTLDRGPARLWLYGYGAYGEPLDPAFSADALSLLDRGVVIAHAHVRGGGELGARWHDEGRAQHKPRSFSDFLAVAEGLIAAGIAEPQRIVAVGGSAGGLLVAAAINAQPQRFCAAVLQVPFVDVLNTMLDPDLPLTQLEYNEWGNPQLPAQRAAIASWSPYDQLRTVAYPPLLVSAGLHDGQVGYWEAAKYVARLRRLNQSSMPVLLRTDLGTGHQGPSGRYASLDERALELGFALYWLGAAATTVGGD